VSHALRTPLASIIGSLSALEGQGEELREPVAVDLIETAKEEAERLNLLVRDLLDMTRLQSGHLKLNLDWYDLEDVIGAALAGARDSLAEHPVRVDLPSQPLLVRLDEVLIVQVLDNLLENSCKYSEPGSPIEVQVRKTADSVEITVADWGPGIPAEDSERVFDKFYRSVKPGGGPPGSGLGLAICRGIVEAHGGRIWTRACTHPGTEMVFTLPLGEVIAGGEHGD
jgi:two-component system sensor histidine kinase KdpD